MSKTICIGIVAYDGLDHQVSEDYMRLMFHLGRRHPEYNFQLAIKGKSEQFRARNAIVKAALQFNADYIWMLDDDHILDIGKNQTPSDSYDLPIKLVKHLEENEKIGIVGALYYQRGADCYPVIMQEKDGLPYFLTHAEISNRMQKVDVTGGGCMMIKTSIFDKIEEPWFDAEHEFGTDIQLAKQARNAGYEVWCDTSLEIGHLQKEKRLVTSETLNDVWKEESRDHNWHQTANHCLNRYRKDAEEYLDMDLDQIADLANTYKASDILEHKGDVKDYYKTRGKSQLARQVMFHHNDFMEEEMNMLHSLINTGVEARGADYGCGSAPVTFELALKGHKMDFIDLDGSGAYEFTKWRIKKHNLDCGLKLKGQYDYIFMLDSIEHIEDWKSVLTDVCNSLKPKSPLITNYFRNTDFNNPEHISMDHKAVAEHLTSLGMTPINDYVWVKQESGIVSEKL
jgi:2-polyprenyl-3-methyl-5-hydroxy-6-metoxy-1,4-benzoquinol methylase